MANNVQRNSSSGWLVGVVVAILVVAAIVWATSARWGGYSGSNHAGAAGSQTTTGAAGANKGTTGGNAGTNAGHSTSGTNNGSSDH